MYHRGMTMVSFRLEDTDAAAMTRWAAELGVDRSTFLRDAVRLHIVRLAAEREVAAWVALPASTEELALAEVADWGPAEDWSDWADATR